LSKNAGLSLNELEGRADVYEDQGAMHHLFNVASSLDSMVIGETQIVKQLKDAYKFAIEHDFCGPKLSRAMHAAFKCAAEVRNSSSISSKPVSIASVAVNKAKAQFPTIEGKKALIIGAGEMSRLCAQHLSTAGCHCLIMNRTMEKAQAIAHECGALVCVDDYKALKSQINECDLVFTATGAPHAIITKEMIEATSFERHWFDMAIPRDIDDSDMSGLTIHRIDDLKNIVNVNMALREDEAKLCYSIVGQHTIDFFEQLQSLSIEPFIKGIYERAQECASQETARVVAKGYIPAEYEEQMKKMNEQVLKRFLHEVTKRIRHASSNEDADSLVESMKYLCENSTNTQDKGSN
jgi:glutamyl-tRNA reductase